MDVKRTMWDMYDKRRLGHNDAYVDPLYRPYQRVAKEVTYHTGRKGTIMVNPHQKQGKNTNPALERRGWGMSFQKMHPSDPCPTGFIPGADGWCFEIEPEHTPTFYTKRAFLPKRQFHAERKSFTGKIERSNYGIQNRQSKYAAMPSGDMLMF